MTAISEGLAPGNTFGNPVSIDPNEEAGCRVKIERVLKSISRGVCLNSNVDKGILRTQSALM